VKVEGRMRDKIEGFEGEVFRLENFSDGWSDNDLIEVSMFVRNAS
jgi:hypothetical protein